MSILSLSLLLVMGYQDASAQKKTLREHGFPIGIFDTGKNNAITDVPGVTVGQVTCIDAKESGLDENIAEKYKIFVVEETKKRHVRIIESETM